MAFKLTIDDDLSADVRRLISEQINIALSELSSRSEQTKAIHQTRKCIKRIRATIKLIRPGLETDRYKTENQRFRAIANSLSQARDNDVIDATLVRLRRDSSADAHHAVKRARDALRRQQRPPGEHDPGVLAEAHQQLTKAARDYRHFDVNTTSGDILYRGLRTCYAQARRAQRIAYRDGGDEAFHEWRKPVQLHWRHMALFTNAWPDMFKARVELARSLSQCLGDDHDLSILMTFLEKAVSHGDISENAHRTLVTEAQKKQQAYRDIAKPMGAILFQQTAKAHAKHVLGIWTSAQVRPRQRIGSDLIQKKKIKTEKAAPATTDAS